MSSVRPALAVVALAATAVLAGCKSEQAPTARSIQSLSPQTVSLMTEKGMSRSDPILLRVFKEESKAEVWKKRRSDGKYALLKSYDICRFSGKLGPKIKEGDKQAPEGFYSVGPAQMNPRSSYYLSFNIGFPNRYDQSLGRTGRHVMMHGDCLSAGCYAMTDAQMAEIYALAREAFNGGQKTFQVQALPFRMTAQNMARRRNDKNMPFWKNLKQGSDHFEVAKAEPKVDVCGKKYVFNAQTGPLSSFEPTMQCPSYQVEPSIARAVAAKEKTDNVLIAQLSKSEAIAPEYVAQNGRLRRSLDEPIIEVAAVVPAAPGAVGAAAAGPASPTLGPSMGAAAATPVALRTPLVAVPATTGTVLAEAKPDAAKPEGGLFARMFGAPETAQPASVPPTQPQPGPTLVAAKQPAKPDARQTGPRRIAAEQTPVMASSVGPAPADEQPSGVRAWIGGLFGKDAAPAPAEQQQVVPASAPVVAPKARDRSAAMPEAFIPRAKTDRQVTASYATVE